MDVESTPTQSVLEVTSPMEHLQVAPPRTSLHVDVTPPVPGLQVTTAVAGVQVNAPVEDLGVIPPVPGLQVAPLRSDPSLQHSVAVQAGCRVSTKKTQARPKTKVKGEFTSSSNAWYKFGSYLIVNQI